MSFGTVIDCMEGRVQTPVNNYLSGRFGVNYVDVISAAGPAGCLQRTWIQRKRSQYSGRCRFQLMHILPLGCVLLHTMIELEIRQQT